MHSHTAIELLKTLNNEELRSLRDFISSPYYNGSEVLVKLFDIIAKQKPDYTGNVLKRENLYKKIYPGKEFNEPSLRSRMAELLLLIKRFMANRNFEQKQVLQNLCLIEFLSEKKKTDMAEKLIKESLLHLEKEQAYDEKYFKQSLELLSLRAILNRTTDSRSELLELNNEAGEYLLNYFLIDIVGINQGLSAIISETGKNPEINFIELFMQRFDYEGYLESLKEMNYRHYPVLAVYYYAQLASLFPGNVNYYYKLKEQVFKHYRSYKTEELYNYWSILSNAAYFCYLENADAFKKERHEVDKFFIEKKLYTILSALSYQNSVANAIVAGETAWAEGIAEKYKDELAAEVKENLYNFCMALITSAKREFERSLDYLSKVNYADWHSKINVRLLYLKNYYELGMSEQVFSLIDSFSHLLSDNKTIPSYAESYIKTAVTYIRKLANSKFNGREFDYADYNTASSKRNFSQSEWILEKMKELL